MSDNKPTNDWVKDWEALQRQYLSAWSDLAQKAPSAASAFGAQGSGAVPGMPQWHEGLEQWSRLFGSAAKQGDTVERLVESGKGYIAMIKAMLGAGAAGTSGETSPAQSWFEAMRGGFAPSAGFEMPGMDASFANSPFLKAVRDIAGQGAKGFGDLPAAFAPFLEQQRQENLSWLRLPAFGIAREHQEHYQRTAVAFADYQQALRNYNALLLKASERGLALLEDKLAERAEPGRAIDSPRALYDLWVDAAEEAYAEIALSDDFVKAYGELANTQMRMRAQIHAEVERLGTDLGMPTRTELNSVHQRLHDLRREFRDSGLTGRSDASDPASLAHEVAELRDEVARLKAQVARNAPRAMREPKASAAETRPVPAKAKPTAAKTKPPAKSRVRKPHRVAPAPPPVVRPKAMAKAKEEAKGAPKFGDAVAALRRRVGRSGGKSRVRAAAAQVVNPARSERSGKKSRKPERDR